ELERLARRERAELEDGLHGLTLEPALDRRAVLAGHHDVEGNGAPEQVELDRVASAVPDAQRDGDRLTRADAVRHVDGEREGIARGSGNGSGGRLRHGGVGSAGATRRI